MQRLHRFALAALVLAALAPAPRARATDAAPSVRPSPSPPKPAEPAAPYTATRTPLPAGEARVLLAPSFQFEGVWMLDAAHSDDPVKVMQASRPSGGPGGEGGPRMGGGRAPRGGQGDGFGGRGGMRPGGDDSPDGDHPDQPAENRPRDPSPMGRVMRPPAKLVIDMQPDQLTLSEDGRGPRAYAIADSLRAHRRELLTENTSARWRNGALELTQSMGPRGRLVETYTLSHDGGTLTIRARRAGGRDGMPNPVISRVYTRYEGE